MREVISGMMSELGYHMLQANNAQGAISIASSHSGDIHLLLTDVIMPDMDGPELAARLRASRPGLKVLYVSGHPASVLDAHGLAGHQKALLQKPFTVKVLSATVREILDEPSGS